MEDSISDQSEDSSAANSQGEKMVLNNLAVPSNKRSTTREGDKKINFNPDKATGLLKAAVNISELTSSAFHLISLSQDEIKYIYFSNSIDDKLYESLAPTLSLDAYHSSL